MIEIGRMMYKEGHCENPSTEAENRNHEIKRKGKLERLYNGKVIFLNNNIIHSRSLVKHTHLYSL